MAETELLRIVVRPEEAELVRERAIEGGYDSVSAYVRAALHLRGPGIGSPAVTAVVAEHAPVAERRPASARARDVPDIKGVVKGSLVPDPVAKPGSCPQRNHHRAGVYCKHCGVTP